MDSILITGGAGMIGSHLIDILIKQNKHIKIYVIDDLSVGKISNIPVCNQVKFINGSALDPVLLNNLISKVDLVYHLATLKKGSDSSNSLDTLDTIVGTARLVLENCLKYSVRVVLASTSDAYGYGTSFPFNEDDPISLGPLNTRRWSYAVAKLYTEQVSHEFYRNGLDVRIIRYFGGFSERASFSWRGGHVPLFIYNAYNDIDISIHGDGLQTRCVTHGSDLARGTFLVGTKDGIAGELFNIGGKEEISVVEAARRILNRFPKSKTVIKHINTDEVFGKYNEILRRRPNVDKAKQVLGFESKINFDTGVDIMVEHIQSKPKDI